MSPSDDRRTAERELADACRFLAGRGELAPPAIGIDQPKRQLSKREAGWLSSFNRKMADLGQRGMEEFLRNVSRQLRKHETIASLAFRPLRFSNELPVMVQLAEAWREGRERRQIWSSFLYRIVLQQIGRKAPPSTNEDWSFLRDSWRLAGVMDLPRSPAAAARNQIDAFQRVTDPNDAEFAKLLAVMDSAIASDTARSDPSDLTAILLFRRRLAQEPSAPVNSAARLLAAWTHANSKGIRLEKSRPRDDLGLSDTELKQKVVEDWANLSNDPLVRSSLEALTTDSGAVGTCWSDAARLVLGGRMEAEEAKRRLLQHPLPTPVTIVEQTYESTESLRKLAMAG